jgi:glycosyltransferase involved in cell wall biosynthesis
LVATGYFSQIERCISGGSVSIAQAGMKRGILDGCFTLAPALSPRHPLFARYVAWCVGQRLRGRGTSGFKFVPSFLEAAWRPYFELLEGCDIVSNFQLLPASLIDCHRRLDIRIGFCIDGTLREYFESYSDFELSGVDQRTIKRAIELEKYGYRHSSFIVALSRRTRGDLVQHYHVDPSKIVVEPPGACLPEDVMPSEHKERTDFVLGFVGLYPERKGLPKLASAVQSLRRRGLNVRIRVIGRVTKDLESSDFIDYCGIIDKLADPARFADLVSTVDLGCMLSFAELTGYASCEFLRLGVPVVITSVGGFEDIASGGGCIVVEPSITVEALADLLEGVLNNPEKLRGLRAAAASRRNWATWARVAQAIAMRFDMLDEARPPRRGSVACG